jgi:hypothetical protein
MALVSCPECGGRISSTAASCPRCGNTDFLQRTGRDVEVTCHLCYGTGTTTIGGGDSDYPESVLVCFLCHGKKKLIRTEFKDARTGNVLTKKHDSAEDRKRRGE